MKFKYTKRTKVICTLGPSVDSEVTLKNLIAAGMDVARLNFSHGDQVEHLARINRLKKVRKSLDAPCAIMLDMSGQRIRTGRLAHHKPVLLQAGRQITLTEEDVEGTDRLIGVSFRGLASYMEPGASILIDDGRIELAVDETRGSDIICTVQNSGMLYEHKSLNFPDTPIDLPVITEKDKSDVCFGIENGADYITIPSVRNAADVLEVRSFMDQNGGREVGLIAKIVNEQAVENIEEIVDACDAVLVARGDLGVEMDTERVPHIQKRIVELCNARRTPVIIAGQMLDSMMREPRPTRAEVADVASAVYDGADALLLSGETAVGKYPVPTVRMMARIAEASEGNERRSARSSVVYTSDAERVSPAVGEAAVTTADAINASCIVTPTNSGRTARLISNFRPKAPIFAVASSERTMRRMQLYWGVVPMLGGISGASTGETIKNAQRVVRERGLVEVGDLAVLTSGDPFMGPVLPSDEGEDSYVGTSVMYVVQIKESNEGRQES